MTLTDVTTDNKVVVLEGTMALLMIVIVVVVERLAKEVLRFC